VWTRSCRYSWLVWASNASWKDVRSYQSSGCIHYFGIRCFGMQWPDGEVSQVQNSILIANLDLQQGECSCFITHDEVLLKLPPLRYINDFIALLIELSLSLINFKINVTDNKWIGVPSQIEKFQFILPYIIASTSVWPNKSWLGLCISQSYVDFFQN